MRNRYQELSKEDRKIVRELIDKGMTEEFKRGMENFDSLLQQWRSNPGDHREHYANLYGTIRDFNKHIAWQYDNMKGSHIVSVLEYQLSNDVLELSVLDVLSTEVKNELLETVKRRKSYDSE